MAFVFVKVWGAGGEADGSWSGPELGWSWHVVLVPSYVLDLAVVGVKSGNENPFLARIWPCGHRRWGDEPPHPTSDLRVPQPAALAFC